jgi:hypothetical protein
VIVCMYACMCLCCVCFCVRCLLFCACVVYVLLCLCGALHAGCGRSTGWVHCNDVLNSAGVDTGVNMRLANQGDAGPHGRAAGHLYVQVCCRAPTCPLVVQTTPLNSSVAACQINVEPDPFLKRQGEDIHIEVRCASAPLR